MDGQTCDVQCDDVIFRSGSLQNSSEYNAQRNERLTGFVVENEQRRKEVLYGYCALNS